MSRPQIRPLTPLWRGSLIPALVLALGMPIAALAQEPLATQKYVPTRHSEGPNLPITIKFIEDKVNQQGTVNVAGYLHDNATGKSWVLRQSIEQTKVRLDRKRCELRYHKKVISNGNVAEDADSWVLLPYVKEIDVIPKEVAWKLADSKAGNTTWSYKADPPVTVMRMLVSDGNFYDLQFYDEDLANRVAKAMIHAVDLCGGKEEAF